MKDHRNESGAVIMLIAVFSFVLLILIAIAVDLWNFETDNVRMQTAADAGTLAAGMVLTKDLKTDEITAISMQLAAEVDMFNKNLGAYARPPLSQAEAELLLDTTLRNLLIGEGIDAGRINACISNLNPTSHAGITRPSLDGLLRGGIDQNSCIDPTIAGNLTVKLLKEVAHAVARDNLVQSTYRDDEIDGINLVVLDKNGVPTNDPSSINSLDLDVDARSTMFIANHVTGLNVPESYARVKDAGGQQSQAAIVMLLDVSGSMASPVTAGLAPIAHLRQAAKAFAAHFAASKNALALITYSNSASLLRPLQTQFDLTDYQSAIDTLAPTNCTNIDDAIHLAENEWTRTDSLGQVISAGKTKVLLLITDGVPNRVVASTGGSCNGGAPSYYNPQCRADIMRLNNIMVYGVAFGKEKPESGWSIDTDFMKRVTFNEFSHGADYTGSPWPTCTGTGINGHPVKTYAQLTTAGATAGKYYHLADASQLTVVLNAIAEKIKFRLTQ
ncbi:MAG TPA: VWA domain-containing protein [Oligoflexia bacterium]|nr:VWA domain-containing protein [Oligoflexia bacterium]